MDHSKKTSYLFSIDALRVISILAVILIHTSTKSLQSIDHNITVAPLTLFLNQIARFAVPLFFLISGFVLELNYKEISVTKFFKKRASRIIIPFVFWSSLYFLLGNNNSVSDIFSHKFLSLLANGSASYHLYFIPTLIIFYVLFPLLHKYLYFFKKPAVFSIILLTQICLLFLDFYINRIQLPDVLRVAVLVFGMFLLGMYSSHKAPKIMLFIKKYINKLFLLMCACFVFIFFHVYDMTTRLSTTSFIYNQHSPLNYFFTLLVSLVVGNYLEEKQFFRKQFILLSKLSFFVFFIHIIILDFLWENLILLSFNPSSNSIERLLFLDPVFFIFVTVISFTIAYAVHKIPGTAKIFG